MKRILSCLTCMVLLLGLATCNGKKKPSNKYIHPSLFSGKGKNQKTVMEEQNNAENACSPFVIYDGKENGFLQELIMKKPPFSSEGSYNTILTATADVHVEQTLYV